MEHCVLAKKTIKKIEKNNSKQIPKKSLRLAQKNKISDINDSTSLIIKNTETLLDSVLPEEFKANFVKDPQAYQNIPEIPIYTPTLEEFRQPIPLINKLRELGYDKYGCVKLIAPEGWDPEFSLCLQDKLINTRSQVLQDLTKGKSFKQNANSYTLNEYENFANNFLEYYPRKSSTTDFQDIYRADEFEYWSIVEDPEYKRDPVTIEYAADLPTLRYGSAFPKLNRNKPTQISSVDDARIHSFNLNNLIYAKNSLFQIIAKKSDNISGITAPWVYAGMVFASFCWHVEDLYMYSVNYMHKGEAKTWYCVPSSHKEALERVMKEKYGELFIKRPDLLYSIVLTMNPLELVKRNIPVYRTEQKPREFIITFPRVYHAGFSHGFNISEAVNIATPDWIPFAKIAMKDYAQDGFFKKGSFPFEWLILENVKRIRELVFTLEAKKQIAQAYEEIMEKELRDRDTIKKCYTKMSTKHYSDLTSRYDAHICSTCKNYAYLSYLSCMVCKRYCCTHHITVCECLNATVLLYVRFTDKNLTDMKESITSDIQAAEKASQGL